MVKKGFKFRYALLCALVLLASAGVLWAGISNGVLNNNSGLVNLTQDASYSGGTADNPITLEQSAIALTNGVVLGRSGAPTEFANNYDDPADTLNKAGGAIFVDYEQTLTIQPTGAVNVAGENNLDGELRLFGEGTTNLYNGGVSNRYTGTFVQNGRLNLNSVAALGGSRVTLGGGATLGFVDGVTALDLSGVQTMRVRRYDAAGNADDTLKKVTFDTAKSDMVLTLPAITQTVNSNAGGESTVKIVKTGFGKLVMNGATTHTGGLDIEEGTLELRAVPNNAQTAKIYSAAVLSVASSLTSIAPYTLEPAALSTIALPAVTGAAAPVPSGTGTARLAVTGFDLTSLGSNGEFSVTADISAVTSPSSTGENFYYIKLINSAAAHGLTADNVRFSGMSVPSAFAGTTYSVVPYVDANNIYAMLSKDVTPTESVRLSVSRGPTSATLTATLSDAKSGEYVTISMYDESGMLYDFTGATNASGKVSTNWSLAKGEYTATASATGYNPSSTLSFVIDGQSSSTVGTWDVQVYDDPDGEEGVIYVLLNSDTAFPNGDLFYQFKPVSGSGTIGDDEVVENDVFKATNVTYSANGKQARFKIDLNNLVDINGKRLTLNENYRYRLFVYSQSSDGSTTTEMEGDSDTVIDADGVYYADGMRIRIRASKNGSTSVAVYAKAVQNGFAYPNLEVQFMLRDEFGQAVKKVAQTAYTSTDGETAVVTFSGLDYGTYSVRATTTYGNHFSNLVELVEPGSGGSSGCSTGAGLMSLIAAVASLAVIRRKR